MTSLLDMSAANEMIIEAENIVVFSGSGLSKASGVPTYRDANDPLWQTHDPKIYGSRHGLVNHTDDFIKMYTTWREQLRRKEPNEAHFAIAKSDKIKHHITQNVDDLSERAGKPAIHLHGEVMKDRYDPELHIMRPDVVLFGECLPITELMEAHDLMKNADLLIAIGTSLEVQPAAELWQDIAKDDAAIFINPVRVEKAKGLHIQGTAEEVMPLLFPDD